MAAETASKRRNIEAKNHHIEAHRVALYNDTLMYCMSPEVRVRRIWIFNLWSRGARYNAGHGHIAGQWYIDEYAAMLVLQIHAKCLTPRLDITQARQPGSQPGETG